VQLLPTRTPPYGKRWKVFLRLISAMFDLYFKPGMGKARNRQVIAANRKARCENPDGPVAEPQHPVLRVDQQQIGFEVAFPMVAPFSPQRMVTIFSRAAVCRPREGRRRVLTPLPVRVDNSRFSRAYSRGGRRWFAQSSAFKSAIKSETLRNEGSPPWRASCIAAAVAALGAFTSKGRDFSAATRVSRRELRRRRKGP